jgi:DNA-binding transcriptional ArsR family regulator
MNRAYEELANLDRLIHEPARLAVLTALCDVASADYLFLQHLTGLTAGNLSAHLSKLADAGLVSIEKQFVNHRPNTQVQITPQGRAAIETHWKKLEDIRRATRHAMSD